ncbi:Aste57867_22698 [Aphanomyces stellatus]|uniref:Aste57867_22698 protein n=1 Tax=Aphanomyces stellatus TaxID=120398 RepID=A0A485LKQ6_9STRA|nr:hypothetical protein As57867_022628 [Aphanomyces stellatus]VFT99352.1 Aste57867_22698 [Aphanomyces stellatus]
MQMYHQVLATPDLLRLILQFQDGYTQDMVVFTTLVHSSSKSGPSRRDTAKTLTPWLAQYELTTRLPVALDLFPNLRQAILEFASLEGRVDVLDVVHIHYLPAGLTKIPASHLEEPASSNGHLHVLEYLHSIGCERKHWHQCTTLAINGGHMPVLEYLHDTYAFKTWFNEAMLTKAFRTNKLAVFAFLYKAWMSTTPKNNDDERRQQEHKYLDLVVTKASLDATWMTILKVMVPAMQIHNNDAVVKVFMTNRRSHVMVECLDASFHVPLRDIVVSTRPDEEQLRRLFDTFPWLREPGPAQDDAWRRYFVDAIHMINLPIMQWLVQHPALDRRVAQEVLENDQRGLEFAVYAGNLEMINLYAAFGVPISDVLVQKALNMEWTKVHLVKYLVHDPTAILDGWYAWLVARYGGRVAVMGHLIQHAMQSKVLFDEFPALYKAWQDEADENDKEPVQASFAIVDTWSRPVKVCKGTPSKRKTNDLPVNENKDPIVATTTRKDKPKRKTRFTRPQPASALSTMPQVAQFSSSAFLPKNLEGGSLDRDKTLEQSCEQLAKLALV